MSELWFREEADEWNKAIPVGNGFLGAMVFGGTETERIQVNEDSVWSGGFMDRVNPNAKENLYVIRKLLKEGHLRKAEQLAARSMYGIYPHMRHYQVLGDIWLRFMDVSGKQYIKLVDNVYPVIANKAPEILNYSRKLDLETALGEVSYERNGGRFSREFFASNPSGVIVYKIKAWDKVPINLEVELTRKDNRRGRGSSFCDGSYAENEDTICLYGVQGGAEGIGFEMAVRINSTGGKQYSMGSRIIVENAREVILYVTGRTTVRSGDPHKWCIQTLNAATSEEPEKLKKRHIADYRKYFTASRLTLETEEDLRQYTVPERLQRMRQGKQDIGLINLYYNFARYLMISASREHSFPMTLQGLWNEDFEPAWGSKYTLNINTEMNYWQAEKTGLSELHMPLMEHLKRMHEHGKDVAEKMYGARGFCCHHNTDIWGDCAPQDNSMSATIWPMGGAWLCLHIIEHYRYTKDRCFMEEYYEILKDAVLFALDYMVQDENGYWITGPSCSPENIYQNEKEEYGSLCMGPVMDTEILTELFQGFLEISKELEISDDTTEEAKRKLSAFPPLKIGVHGQIQEWQKDYREVDVGHRHISQLFALYPGSQIRRDMTPELAEAARCTLERRLQNGGGHTGWSKAWIILFYARLGKKKEAWKHLEELLKNATLDNLFDNHPPFQIDGNFGGACGLLEMLVQDYGDTVYVLPALPDNIPAGSLTGICLKNGAVMDLSWEYGRVKEACFTAKRDCCFMFAERGREPERIELQQNERKTMEGKYDEV